MNGARVLVVDDDRTIRETLGEILAIHGYETELAGTGADAVALTSSWKPEVAVIDYRLPDGNGVDVAEQCKAIAPDLGVVVLTGHASTGSAMAAVGKVEEFLEKPAPPETLEAAVARAAERGRLRAENRRLMHDLQLANERLEARVDERTRQIAALLDVASATSRSLEIGEVTEEAVRAVAAATSSSVALYLSEPSGGIRLRACAGEADFPDLLLGTDDVPAGMRSVPLQVPGSGMLVVAAGGDDAFVEAAAATIGTGLRNAEAFVAEREASRLKSMMLASVSHELRTPLTVIAGFVAVLLAQPDRPVEDRKGEYEILQRNAKRLQELVEDLLDSGAIQGRSVRVECVEMNLANALANAMMLSPTAVEVCIDVDSTHTLYADKMRFEQVIINVLSNVDKYGDKRCRITSDLRDDRVRISVCDEGPGFPDDFLPQAFDPFSQGGSDAEATRIGAGLGLYLCRGFVEAMGGRMGVRNLDHGACIDIELPAVAPLAVA